LSARAAAQLEYLGFSGVYRYTRGKADWIVRGLPSEPSAALSERVRAFPYFVHNLYPAIRRNWITLSHRRGAGSSMSPDLPRLRPDEVLPDSLAAPAPPLAVVLDGAGVILGAIDNNRPGISAIQVMNPAPQTIRPDMTRALASTLLRHSAYLLISDINGRYLGRYAT
jgi:hypothetical protein